MTINWADVAVVLIIAISCIVEYKRGFVKSIFKMFSFILSIFLSWTLHPYVSTFLKDSFIYGWVKNGVSSNLFKGTTATQALTAEQQSAIIDKLSIPELFKDIIKKSDILNNNSIIDFTAFKESIINFVTNIFMSIIAVIAVILVSLIILKILETSLNLIAKLPLVKEINQSFGFVLGLAIGIIEVWFGFIIIVLLFGTNANMAFVFTEINTSTVAKLFYENNLLNYIIAGIFGH